GGVLLSVENLVAWYVQQLDGDGAHVGCGVRLDLFRAVGESNPGRIAARRCEDADPKLGRQFRIDDELCSDTGRRLGVLSSPGKTCRRVGLSLLFLEQLERALDRLCLAWRRVLLSETGSACAVVDAGHEGGSLSFGAHERRRNS